jgi:hypothetical protein
MVLGHQPFDTTTPLFAGFTPVLRLLHARKR